MVTRDFTEAHAAHAARIARQNYLEERTRVPELPAILNMPDLKRFAQNRLGVATFEGGEMVGFLCVLPPFQNAFRSTQVTGVFSPIHANGAIGKNRAEVYACMYQVAGKKWAEAGAASHAVALYAHDTESQQQFFQYGFGLRCIDALRDMTDIKAVPTGDICFFELSREDFPKVLPLNHMLDAHMAASPTFILRPSETETSFMEKAVFSNTRFFAAEAEGKPVAFLQVQPGGETFISDALDYIHITGAFCLPEYRGKGIYRNLLALAVRTLRGEGYARLGVDFESINPTAHRFWLKDFREYTRGLVRRIDENCLTAR